MSGSTESVQNSRSQSMDTVYLPDGSKRIKLAVGTKAVSGDTEEAGWQGAATHEDGATFVAGDGVVVLGALSEADGETVLPLLADADGHLLATVIPSRGNLTDISGDITAGGTAQELTAVNLERRYLLIQNLDLTEDLWIDFTSDAVVGTPSIKIPPDGIFVMEGNFVSTEKVTVIATTTGHEWTAREG